MPRYNEPPTHSEMEDDLLAEGPEPQILDEVTEELNRQIALKHGGDTGAFDRDNTRNDWIAYITAYIGRASQKVARNEREGQNFRDNMIKAAALCVRAISCHDQGWC